MEADCEIPSLFTELLELTEYHDGRQEWKEVARWIKYEETVEEEGNRSGHTLAGLTGEDRQTGRLLSLVQVLA